jgi:hypothetical protein
MFINTDLFTIENVRILNSNSTNKSPKKGAYIIVCHAISVAKITTAFPNSEFSFLLLFAVWTASSELCGEHHRQFCSLGLTVYGPYPGLTIPYTHMRAVTQRKKEKNVNFSVDFSLNAE